jgi:hypothetical protein
MIVYCRIYKGSENIRFSLVFVFLWWFYSYFLYMFVYTPMIRNCYNVHICNRSEETRTSYKSQVKKWMHVRIWKRNSFSSTVDTIRCMYVVAIRCGYSACLHTYVVNPTIVSYNTSAFLFWKMLYPSVVVAVNSEVVGLAPDVNSIHWSFYSKLCVICTCIWTNSQNEKKWLKTTPEHFYIVCWNSNHILTWLYCHLHIELPQLKLEVMRCFVGLSFCLCT